MSLVNVHNEWDPIEEILVGRTTFSNTILALKYASPESKMLWNKVTGIYQRKMEFYNSKIATSRVS